jgi:hypothetical protein
MLRPRTAPTAPSQHMQLTHFGLVAEGYVCAPPSTVIITVVTETTSEAAELQTIKVISQSRPILMVSLVLLSRRLPILDQTQQARMSHDRQMIQADRIWELNMVSHHLMATLYTCTNVIPDLSWRQRVGAGVGPGVTGGLLLMFFA